jgi:ribosomal protein L32
MMENAMKATSKSKKNRKREAESRAEPAAEMNVQKAPEEVHVPGRLSISPDAVERLIAEAEFQQHPYGKVWQRFDLDGLAELAGNIVRRGLDQEILLFQGTILEGWHRYLACLATKTTPKFAEFQGSDLEAAERVHASGIRRQSTPEQRYASFVLLCDACPEFKAKYEELKEKGTQQQQAGTPLSIGGQRVDVLGAKAVAAGVSRSTAAKVEKVKKEEPAAVADIAAGKTSANKILKKPMKIIPPSDPHTLSFPSSRVARGEAQDAGPMTASFAGDEPSNVPEPLSDDEPAQDEERPSLAIDYDIKATVTLANGINAATFEDESNCGVAHWLVKNGNGKTLATIKVTNIQRSGS